MAPLPLRAQNPSQAELDARKVGDFFLTPLHQDWTDPILLRS